MNCRKLSKELTAYTSDELGKLDRQRIGTHLQECSSCREALASLENTRKMLRFWADAEPASDLLHEFEARLSEAVVRKAGKPFLSFKWPSRKWIYGFVMIACLAVAIYSGFHFLSLSHEKPSEVTSTSDTQIGFYIAEHESSIKQVSFQKTAPSPRGPLWIPFRKENMLYYDTFSGESEEAQGQSGVILKGGNHWEKTSDIGEKSGNEVVISEGEVLNLDEARKAVSFDIVAPAALSEGYRLTVIRKIRDRECIQLVYSDGARTISLFEQPVLPKERLKRGDFREYLLHLAKDKKRTAVLGWHTDKVSFNLVGETKLPDLIEMAGQVQERLTTDNVKNYYKKIYEE